MLKVKNFLCIILAFMISVTSLLSMDTGVPRTVYAASAKERVETFIGLAAGKSQANPESLSELTQDELQFLGVYLSNFYIPFCTELGAADTEVLDAEKAQMVQALSSGLNFNTTVSEALVEYIVGLSRANNQKLEFRVSAYYIPTDQSNYVTLDDFDVNYYTFLNLMMGNAFEEDSHMAMDYIDQIYSVTKDSDGKITAVNEPKYKYGYFGYTRDGNFIPMFDCVLWGSSGVPNTASMDVFAQCLGNVQYTMGVGTNFFDFTKEEIDDVTALNGALSDWTDDLVYKMSVYGAEMRVDCFGNIICMGGNHQYIVVPGCMNPYTWVAVNDDGSDLTRAGEAYQVITFMGMGLADTGQLFGPSSGEVPKNYTSGGSGSGSSGTTPTLPRPGGTGSASGGAGSALNQTIGGALTTTNPNVEFENGITTGGIVSFNKFKEALDLATKDSIEINGWITSVIGNIGDVFTGATTPNYIVGNTWYLLRGSNDTTFDNDVWGSGDGNEILAKATNGLLATNPGGWYWCASQSGSWDATQYDDHVLYNAHLSEDDSILIGHARTNQKIKLLTTYMFIDNLGAFGFDSSGSDIEYNALQPESYIDDNGNGTRLWFQNWLSDSTNGFSSIYNTVSSGTLNTTVNVTDQTAVVGVYTSYAIAGLYMEGFEADTVGKLGYRMNRSNLPEISATPIVLPSSIADDIVNNNIRNWIYYILHPTQGMKYVSTLIKNKVNGILISWHNDMLGTNGVGITTGTTAFRTNYGYVTTPDLSEIQWASTLISFYNSIIPILIVFMVISMLLAFVTGVMPFQRALFAIVAFSAFLFIPVNAINWVVGTANRISSNIYGEKFTYWAVVQEETYGSAIDAAAEGDSYSNYLRTLYASSAINQGSESIVLKWQAPKKMASLMLTSTDNSLVNGLQSSLLTNSILRGSAYSGETYLDGDSQYMYRDYSDIANFSRYIYNGLKIGTRSIDTSLSQMNIPDSDVSLRNSISRIGSEYSNYVNAGYTGGGNSYRDAKRIVYPLTSDIYRDIINTQTKQSHWDGMSIERYVGLNQDLFNFSVAMFNNKNIPFMDTLKENINTGNNIDYYLSSYTEADFTALASYGLMSESPFYYYSWKLYDDGMNTASGAYDGYRRLLLGDTEGGYFYNNKGNGELKDFMDMRSLFTYVIPYLKEGNNIVQKWDDMYGVYVHDGVYTEEGHSRDSDVLSDATLRYKYWHNLNVARLYMIYTPWVDLMYDCSYAQPTYVTVMGEKFPVEDPLNPASYPVERPMIFSESEMYDYGLTEADLTAVERKILEFNRGAQERMYELLNYYNFSDLALNTAAAINCTFEFNNTFSENGLFSSNINLYPQTFEIKDFSYDAFLRFILSNTTGISMTTTGDFYENIVNQSSTTTAILLLLLDILSQYALPAFKIFILIAVFISSILLCMVGVFKVDPRMKFLTSTAKSILIPLLQFFLITVAFAVIISLFMGTGNNAVTQSNTMAISMGDPNIVILTMCALDIVCLILYFKIIKRVIADIKHNFKLAVDFEGGVFGGAIAGVAGLVSSAATGVKSGFGGGSNSAAAGAATETGTGKEAGRASQRAANASSVISKHEDTGLGNRYEDSERVSNSKRRTTSFEKDTNTDNSKTKDINEKIKLGTGKLSMGSNKDSKEENASSRRRNTFINQDKSERKE